MRFTPVFAALLVLWGSTANAAPIGALPEDDVLGYLEQLVQWQSAAAALEPTSMNSTREVIYQDSLHQNALKALQGGFKFARLQAGMQVTAEAPTAGEEVTPRQRMQARAKETEAAVTELQARLKAKNLSPAQRQSLEGRLKLAQAKQQLFATVVTNMANASTTDAKGLAGKINNLAREIPDLTTENAKLPARAEASAGTTTTVVTAPAAPQAATILSLSSALFDTVRKQRDLKDFASQTEALELKSRDLMKPLRTELDAITGNDINTPIDAQVTSFKQIGAVLLPLGETMISVRASKAALADWQNALEKRLRTLGIQLGVKLTLLGAMLSVPLIVGEFIRRMIGRYLVDPKRKRWAHTARRVVVGVAIVFVLLMNFVSDFGSFATFAGFLTAGLAVALQGVLMSLVAHFFFYGRYGVRPGDRVNVSGVNGDILQIGLLRFYLRELSVNDTGEWQANGRIVSFPNSILFQPTGFYKYVGEVP